MRGEVHEAEGLLFLGEKLITCIPQGMRQDLLNCIQESHLGIEKCKSRARAVVYWPGMSAVLKEWLPMQVSQAPERKSEEALITSRSASEAMTKTWCRHI